MYEADFTQPVFLYSRCVFIQQMCFCTADVFLQYLSDSQWYSRLSTTAVTMLSLLTVVIAF